MKDQGGEKRLVAYFVAPSNPTREELFDYLSASLPRNLIPSAFVPINELPFTSSGKLDLQSLPSPDDYGSSLEIKYASPRDDLEKALASIFSELLQVHKVGINDNFFHLGGNSLMTVRLCYKVNKLLGKSLQVANVFTNPTIAQLAPLLREHTETSKYVMVFGGKDVGNPVFFMPGISRNALVFKGLARRLELGGLNYGLELPIPEEEEGRLQSLEELVEHCVNEILKIQPQGPYTLVGYSFGGLLAFEAARQLYRPGIPVPKVFLFDSRHRSKVSYSLAERLLWFARMLIKEKQNYLRYVFKEITFQLGRRLGLFSNDFRFIPIEILTGGIYPIKALRFHFNYSPNPLPLDLMIFTVRDTEYSITSGNQLKRWINYSTGRIKFSRIDVDYHHQILDEDQLESICKNMNDFVDDKESS